MTSTAQRLLTSFRSNFDCDPLVAVQAPGRVNLIGEHTDYNDGFVLPCAINYRTVVAAVPRTDTIIRVIAADYDNDVDEFDVTGAITPSSDRVWANYVRGTILCLRDRGFQLGGADLVVAGDVPQGAGLSSSASLEVAVGQMMVTLNQLDVSREEVALVGQQAENEFVGCNCGIMDQMISALGVAGHAMLLDCRSLEVTQVPIPDELAVVIVNSNKQRGLVDSEYNTRREQCERAARILGVTKLRDSTVEHLEQRYHLLDATTARRARHVVSENDRTVRAATALQEGDVSTLGRLMAASHASMRDDFEITVPEIDLLVEIIQEVIGEDGGARMTGGGFGGCVVALAPRARVEAIREAVAARYESATGLRESFFTCEAGPGVGLADLA